MRNTFIAILLISVLFVSCRFMGSERVSGSGNSSKEDRNVGSFSGVETVGSMQVIVLQGASHAVRLEGDDNLLEYVETEVDGDVLEIKPRRGYNLRPRAGLKIYVTAPHFDKLSITGSGKITSQSKITSQRKMEVDITGSGDIEADVNAPEVYAEITGSGTIRLKGTTRKFTSEISGSGDTFAWDLLSEDAKVEIAGSGNVQLFASKSLNVEIAGSGDVQYKGNPSVSTSKAGSGTIKKVD
jgi:hypothetical protein